MQLVAVEKLQPGMRLARDLFRADGSLLLARGVVLTEATIAAMRRHQVAAVYIADSFFDSGCLPEPVRQAVRIQAEQAVSRALHALPARRFTEADEVLRAVEQIVADVVANPAAVVALLEARSVEDELMQHSAGVAVLSVCLGMQLGLSRTGLYELGLGALLHDVGKAVVPPAILYKEGPLTPEERKVVEIHPEQGFLILRRIKEIPLPSAHVAYQHHERMDGSGYPRGLREAEIHLYGAIVAVADVYDALNSPRPYRGPIHPAAALYWIRQRSGMFHEQVMRALARVVAPYPIATLVELSTGDVALVRDLSSTELDRPQVVLLRDAEGRQYREVRVLDLSRHPEIQIIRHLDVLTSI